MMSQPLEAVRQGAQDYLVKGEINGPLVMRVIRYAIERKQVEAVLRASEARYRTLVETSPSGITLADLEGKLLLCNQQATRLYGYANPDAMIGINVFKLVAPADRRLAVLNTQRTLNENRVTNAEYTFCVGTIANFRGKSVRLSCATMPASRQDLLALPMTSLSGKKRLKSEKQLVMLEKEFISSVSHELRTPLVSLMEYLNLLRNVKVHGTGALRMMFWLMLPWMRVACLIWWTNYWIFPSWRARD